MFKNLNQLKKEIEVGQAVTVNNKLKQNGGDRIVVGVKSTHFSTGKEITEEEYLEKQEDIVGRNSITEIDGKYYTKIRSDYQKARYMKFDGNKVSMLAYYDTDRDVMIPSPDFEEGDVWIEYTFS